MGSIGTHRPKGMTDKAFFEEFYEGFELLDTSRKGGVIYAAARRRDGTGLEHPGQVFALVMPFSNDRKGYFVFKEQDETMGPYDTRCPDRILDLLTPTGDDNAKDWRAKCRAFNDQERAAREQAKRVTEGTVIRTAEPLFFGKSYGHFDTFRHVKRNTFVAMRDGLPVVRVSLGGDWKMRDYEVVG
jgi:hypothetical protein